MPDDRFLDLLYQAPTRPAAWIDAMERLADLMGGGGAWLSTINVIDGEGHGLWARTDPRFPKAFFGHYAALNPLNNVPNVDAIMRGWHPRIVTEDDLVDPDLLRSSEFYNDFQKPLEATSVAMIRLARHPQSKSTSVIDIGRGPRKGRFEADDLEIAAALHPHMIRAFKLSADVARGQVFTGAAGEPMSGAGRAVVILDGAGRVLRESAATTSFLKDPVLTMRAGKLTAGNAVTASRLAALIVSACAPPPAPRLGGTIAVQRPEGAGPLVVSIAPLHDETLGLLIGEPLALLVVSDPTQIPKPADHVLREVYGLTPAEARLAIALLDGDSMRETAVRLGVTANTAAVHLTRVFDKTGVNRKAALSALLTRLAVFH